MVEDQVLPLVLGMWLPNIVFAAITILIFWRVEQERPIFPEKITDFTADISEKYITPQFRKLRELFHRLLSRRTQAVQPEKKDAEKQNLVIHANAQSRIFHLPGCDEYNCEECTIEFNSVQVAQEAGFVPCRFCTTLIEKNEQ